METKEELLRKLAILEEQEKKEGVVSNAHHRTSGTIASVFSWIGGVLTLCGLLYFVVDNWASFGVFGHIAISLISLCIAHSAGYLLTKSGNPARTGSAFHLIGIILFPTTLAILFDELNPNISLIWWPTVIASLSAATYALLGLVSKRGIFVFFGTLFTYLAVTSLTTVILDESAFASDKLIMYAQLLFGIALFAFSYLLYISEKIDEWTTKAVVMIPALIYTFVPITFFDLSFLTGYGSRMNSWEIGYPFIVGILLYLGLYFKVRRVVFIVVVGLLVWVGIILGELNLLSAPLILALSGVILLLLGIVIVKLKKA